MSRDLRYLPKPSKHNHMYSASIRPPIVPWQFERMAEHLNDNIAADLSIKRDIPRVKDKKGPSVYTEFNPDETIDLTVKKRKLVDDNIHNISSSKPSSEHKVKVRQYENNYNTSQLLPKKRIITKEYHTPGPMEERPLNGFINGSESEVVVKKRPPPKLLSPEERKKQDKAIRLLKLELFNEEMKLVLLKKIQQSQMVKENLLGSIVPSIPDKIQSTINRSVTTPPPLIRGSSSSSSSSKPHNAHHHHHQQSSSKSRHMPGPPPPLVLGSSGRSSSRGTPVNSFNSFPPGYNYHNLPAAAEILRQSSGGVSSPHTDSQTPAQRQAAAKLALRKQLEKTLLQIPPPKPPPPEMHFLPNGNNQEFVYLLGLEWIVNLMVDDSFGKKCPPDPFECIQCGTDFTPVWKWKDTSKPCEPNKPSVVCELCVTSNIKKALKAEHTNRLKTAFVKALQQEQEIEQRMLQQPSPPPPPVSPSPPSHYSSHLLMPPTSRASMTMPKLTPAQQSFLQLQQLAQSLPQPAHMLPFSPLLAYSYQMLGKSFNAGDLQRQYLLDMIPPCSLPQNSSSSSWKT